jgi:hypothetical protein
LAENEYQVVDELGSVDQVSVDLGVYLDMVSKLQQYLASLERAPKGRPQERLEEFRDLLHEARTAYAEALAASEAKRRTQP